LVFEQKKYAKSAKKAKKRVEKPQKRLTAGKKLWYIYTRADRNGLLKRCKNAAALHFFETGKRR
jgi:hypothetical protein